MFRAVFMDIDGTMLDSNLAHARAWSEALQAHGHHVATVRILPLIGMGGDKLLAQVTGISADSDEGQAIERDSDQVFNERYLSGLRPFPRVRELLERLKQRDVLLGVATSAGRDDAHRLLRQTGVEDLFDCAATSDDVQSSKPDPDIVEAALAKCGRPADQVVLIGDTPYDVESARRSHVACIAVRCGGWSSAELGAAIAVFDDPAAILESLDEQPLCSWFRPRAA